MCLQRSACLCSATHISRSATMPAASCYWQLSYYLSFIPILQCCSYPFSCTPLLLRSTCPRDLTIPRGKFVQTGGSFFWSSHSQFLFARRTTGCLLRRIKLRR